MTSESLQTAPIAVASSSGIELRSIDYVSARERHGRALDQVPIWFMGQFQLVTLSLGFIGPSMGLSFGWSTLAGVLGTVLGTIFMALHATQGPVMGLPQMIQSRAQFGYRGVIIPLLAVLIDFLGYNVACAIVAAAGLHALFGIGVAPVVAVCAVLTAVLSIYGHEWVHRAAKWLFWINLPVFGVQTLAIAVGAIHPAKVSPAHSFTWIAFGVQAAAAASNAIAYAPFVSDYSRYLPRNTPSLQIISAVFAGSTISCAWMIGIGAWLGASITASDPVTAIYAAGVQINVPFGTFMALAAVAMNLVAMTMNTYSSGLAVLTMRDCIRSSHPTRALRIGSIILVTVVWTAFALVGGQNVVDTAWLVLTILLYVLVPWTAVNLMDYFFVRRGHYATTQFFELHGIYGVWAWRGLLPYGLGLLAMAPFAVLPNVYTGPIARALGGVDLAWLVGLVVCSGVYLIIAPDVTHERAAIEESERELEGRGEGYSPVDPGQGAAAKSDRRAGASPAVEGMREVGVLASEIDVSRDKLEPEAP